MDLKFVLGGALASTTGVNKCPPPLKCSPRVCGSYFCSFPTISFLLRNFISVVRKSGRGGGNTDSKYTSEPLGGSSRTTLRIVTGHTTFKRRSWMPKVFSTVALATYLRKVFFWKMIFCWSVSNLFHHIFDELSQTAFLLAKVWCFFLPFQQHNVHFFSAFWMLR